MRRLVAGFAIAMLFTGAGGAGASTHSGGKSGPKSGSKHSSSKSSGGHSGKSSGGHSSKSSSGHSGGHSGSKGKKGLGGGSATALSGKSEAVPLPGTTALCTDGSFQPGETPALACAANGGLPTPEGQ